MKEKKSPKSNHWKKKMKWRFTQNSERGGISVQEICTLMQTEEEEDSGAAHVWQNNSKIDQTIRIDVMLNLSV